MPAAFSLVFLVKLKQMSCRAGHWEEGVDHLHTVQSHLPAVINHEPEEETWSGDAQSRKLISV